MISRVVEVEDAVNFGIAVILLLATKLRFVTETELELVFNVCEGCLPGLLLPVLGSKIGQINYSKQGTATGLLDFLTASTNVSGARVGSGLLLLGFNENWLSEDMIDESSLSQTIFS